MGRRICVVVLLAGLSASPAFAAGPSSPWNPFTHSPFSAELEVDSGGITGKHIGDAFHSVSKGALGARFNFGFFRALNFSLGYFYSPQTRTFQAGTPPIGPIPQGIALLHAGNLNVLYGSGEITLLHLPRTTFYLSPGVGIARNGARSFTLITPLGTATTPIHSGTAISFNLGAGVKIFPLKHFGLRLDARDFVSGGGTGSLQSSLPPSPLLGAGPQIPCTPLTCLDGTPYFRQIPVQNNLVFTVGLIFKIL